MEMKDKDTKEGLFKRLWKLGEAEDKYKKLSIQQDWTKKKGRKKKNCTRNPCKGNNIGGDTLVQGARPTLGEKSSTDNSQTGRNGKVRKQADTNSPKNVSCVTRTVGSTLTNSVDSTATSSV